MVFGGVTGQCVPACSWSNDNPTKIGLKNHQRRCQAFADSRPQVQARVKQNIEAYLALQDSEAAHTSTPEIGVSCGESVGPVSDQLADLPVASVLKFEWTRLHRPENRSVLQVTKEPLQIQP